MYEGSKALGTQSIKVFYNGDYPINARVPVTVNANLPVGVHNLSLLLFTANGLRMQTAVTTVTVNDLPPPPPVNSAAFVSQTGMPTAMTIGQTANVSVTMLNNGNTTWTPGAYRLGSANPLGNTTWGLSRVDLPGNVAPGAQVTFNFAIVAPATPGTFHSQWEMVQEGVAWLGGASQDVAVTVTAFPPTATITSPASGTQFTTSTATANVTLNGSAYASAGSVSRLEFFEGTKSLGATTGGLISVTAALGLGSHTIELRATDNLGVVGSGAFTTVKVVAPAPTAAVQSPANGSSYQITNGTSYSVPLIASAASGGATTVTVLEVLDNGAAVMTISGNSVNTTLPLTAGTHALQLRATDNFGATGLSTVATVTVLGPAAPVAASDPTPLPVAITPPHLSNADAGTLPGAMSVSAEGAANYSIALVVPPGTAGMQPELSLSYDSQAQNGLLGLGWSLGGLSSIKRCGKTIAQDGVNGRISFDHADRLCLDGQRLVLVNMPVTDDNYWADNAEYRTEKESFGRIRAQLTGGNRSFKVELKGGRVMTYGSTSSSYVQPVVGAVNSGVNPSPIGAKNGAQSWALDKIADRMGNHIDFSYEQDLTTGEHRPSFIRYGGAGLPSHAAVQFTYVARQDAWKRFIDETRNDLRSRIDHIRTYFGANLDSDVVASGTLVRDYALTYEMSPTSGRSLLNAVQVSARNSQTGAIDILPKTSFSWGKPDPGKQPGFVSKGAWAGAPILTTWKNTSGGISSGMHAEYFAFNDFEHHGYTDVLEKRVAQPGGDTLNSNNPIAIGTSRTSYRYFHNTGNGFAQYTYRLNTGEAFVVLDVGDFDGDGALDLVADTGGSTKICLSPLGSAAALGAPGSTITFTCDPSRYAEGGNAFGFEPYLIDILGDGRTALYGPTGLDGSAQFCIQFQPCVLDLSPPPVLGGKLQDDGSPDFSLNNYTSLSQAVDFAGVGKPYDVRWSNPHSVKYIYIDNSPVFSPHWENLQPTVTMTSFHLPGASDNAYMASYKYAQYGSPSVNSVIPPYAFDAVGQSGGMSADFNGAGYNSLVFGFLELRFVNSIESYSRAEMTLCLSTGRALDCGVRQKYSGAQYPAIRAVGNFVGDGQPSILVEPNIYAAGANPVGSGTFKMCRVTGDDTTAGAGTADANMVCDPWPVANLTGIPAGVQGIYYMDLLGTGRTQIVYYHAGQSVGGAWQEDGRWEVFAPVDLAVAKQALDRIVQVTNGVGAVTTVEYADGLVDGIVTSSGSSALRYPQHATAAPGKIVSRLITSNGTSANRSVSYHYQDAATDLAGRGSLGYAQVSSTDEQTGIRTTSVYRQDWPYTGMAISETVVSGSNVTLSSTTNALNVKIFAQVNGTNTFFTFIDSSKQTLSDTHGEDKGTTTTVNTYGDGWGNLTQQTATVAPTAGGKNYVAQTASAFYNDGTNWLIGLPQTTTKTNIDPDSGTLTRTVSNEYDTTTGLPIASTVEPGNQLYQLRTSYDRSGNNFGLVNKTIQTWYDPGSKTNLTRTVTDVTYDALGRNVVLSKNALGQQESRTYNWATGAPLTLVGPNTLTTSWESNGFGRPTKELRANGNSTLSYAKQCQGDCPLGASVVQITESMHDTARISVPQVVYLDSAGRELRTLTWGFSSPAVAIVVDKRYDAMGRLWESDQPRFDGAAAHLGSRQLYDELGRAISVVTLDETGAEHTATNQYQGLVTVVTNAKTQSRIETRNVAGQLVQVQDPASGLTGFAYEPFGGLAKTIDPNGNVITVGYDLLGRKTSLTDPDLGRIDYHVDPLGQTWEQISPKQNLAKQSTTFEFDALGRMTARRETDLESHWVFDTANKGIGQLAEAYTIAAGVKDYRRVLVYDGLGRPVLTTQTLTDASYTAQVDYDIWGRVVRNTYRRGTGGLKVFDTRYNANGYLARLERGSLVLWQVTAQDAAQRPTQAALGNGLTQADVFNQNTGRLESGALATAAGVRRLQEAYEYDVLGNVMKRTQYWETDGFQENFTYDSLNRVAASQVMNQSALQYRYDAAGNLLSKGTTNAAVTHSYPAQGATAVRPHGVSNMASVGDVHYDENGNLKDYTGFAMSWTSFDMPLTIARGATTASFVYGPEHERTRQTRSDGGVVVYAGNQEVETKAGQVTVKTYWPHGVGVEIDRPGVAATELSWVHTDRLGSPVALTDAAGVLREKLAYDTWGKRRTLDGSSTPDTLDGQVDNRGFTGHEMLDQLDLVHMNGRVYDPLLGRFMSGDPLVQDPISGQSYNRYSYVLNNPTNLTDPTGFASLDDQCTGTHICGADGQGPAGAMLSCSGNCPGAGGGGANSGTGAQRDASGSNKTSAKIDAPAPLAAAGRGHCCGGDFDSGDSSANTPGKVGDASGGPNPCAGKSGCVWVPGKRESYDRNDVRGGLDEHGNSLVYNPRFYNPTAASKVLILGAFNVATIAAPILRAPRAAQTFYRAMSAEHYAELAATGKLAATGETFISPTLGFSQGYDGVVVQFTMERGALSALENIGVRNASSLTEAAYGSMPLVEKGWAGANAFFKAEGGQINIGLGNGKALETFNSYIKAFSEVK